MDSQASGGDLCTRSAEFVQGQINALPLAFRILLAVGLFGFRLLVRLRYFRSFCALTPETRRRIVDAWAYGSFALARTLFRPLRSTALLAYYEFGGSWASAVPSGTDLESGR